MYLTSILCNIRCRYCNGISGTPPPGEISLSVIKNVISQVKELGAESVVVIGGGEPTIYPYFKELVRYINGLALVPVVFTNTVTMDYDLASFLYHENASVMTKLDSLNEEIQDLLASKKGTYRKIQEGLDNLMKVGFANGSTSRLRLGASFVTTTLTLDETPEIWEFCRKHNIYPNQEALVPRGRALTELSHSSPTSVQLNAVKRRLLGIDKQKYGYTWLVHTPLTGNGCLQHMYSVYLTSKGYIRPCADVDVELFNVKEISIKEILRTPLFQMVRNIEKHLGGKCGTCEYVPDCIGCRGIAFSTGINEGLDIYQALKREDPCCDKNEPTI
ncbi:MAG: radical SAM protein [Nanoarchaeota archaeon]